MPNGKDEQRRNLTTAWSWLRKTYPQLDQQFGDKPWDEQGVLTREAYDKYQELRLRDAGGLGWEEHPAPPGVGEPPARQTGIWPFTGPYSLNLGQYPIFDLGPSMEGQYRLAQPPMDPGLALEARQKLLPQAPTDIAQWEEHEAPPSPPDEPPGRQPGFWPFTGPYSLASVARPPQETGFWPFTGAHSIGGVAEPPPQPTIAEKTVLPNLPPVPLEVTGKRKASSYYPQAIGTSAVHSSQGPTTGVPGEGWELLGGGPGFKGMLKPLQFIDEVAKAYALPYMSWDPRQDRSQIAEKTAKGQARRRAFDWGELARGTPVYRRLAGGPLGSLMPEPITGDPWAPGGAAGRVLAAGAEDPWQENLAAALLTSVPLGGGVKAGIQGTAKGLARILSRSAPAQKIAPGLAEAASQYAAWKPGWTAAAGRVSPTPTAREGLSMFGLPGKEGWGRAWGTGAPIIDGAGDYRKVKGLDLTEELPITAYISSLTSAKATDTWPAGQRVTAAFDEDARLLKVQADQLVKQGRHREASNLYKALSVRAEDHMVRRLAEEGFDNIKAESNFGMFEGTFEPSIVLSGYVPANKVDDFTKLMVDVAELDFAQSSVIIARGADPMEMGAATYGRILGGVAEAVEPTFVFRFEEALSPEQFNTLRQLYKSIDKYGGFAVHADNQGMDILNLTAYNENYKLFGRRVKRFAGRAELAGIKGIYDPVDKRVRHVGVGVGGGRRGVPQADGLGSYQEYRRHYGSVTPGYDPEIYPQRTGLPGLPGEETQRRISAQQLAKTTREYLAPRGIDDPPIQAAISSVPEGPRRERVRGLFQQLVDGDELKDSQLRYIHDNTFPKLSRPSIRAMAIRARTKWPARLQREAVAREHQGMRAVLRGKLQEQVFDWSGSVRAWMEDWNNAYFGLQGLQTGFGVKRRIFPRRAKAQAALGIKPGGVLDIHTLLMNFPGHAQAGILRAHNAVMDAMALATTSYNRKTGGEDLNRILQARHGLSILRHNPGRELVGIGDSEHLNGLLRSLQDDLKSVDGGLEGYRELERAADKIAEVYSRELYRYVDEGFVDRGLANDLRKMYPHYNPLYYVEQEERFLAGVDDIGEAVDEAGFKQTTGRGRTRPEARSAAMAAHPLGRLREEVDTPFALKKPLEVLAQTLIQNEYRIRVNQIKRAVIELAVNDGIKGVIKKRGLPVQPVATIKAAPTTPARAADAPAPGLYRGGQRIIDPVGGAAKLPRELAGAKPNYNIGTLEYTPQFESDVDKALFIISQTKKSARDGSYMAWLREQLPNLSDAQLRAAGRDVRSHIKATLTGQPMGDVAIPTSKVAREALPARAAGALVVTTKKDMAKASGWEGRLTDAGRRERDLKVFRPISDPENHVTFYHPDKPGVLQVYEVPEWIRREIDFLGDTFRSDSVLAASNGWFRSVTTTYNPLFIITNVMNDMLTAGMSKGTMPHKSAQELLTTLRGIEQDELGQVITLGGGRQQKFFGESLEDVAVRAGVPFEPDLGLTGRPRQWWRAFKNKDKWNEREIEKTIREHHGNPIPARSVGDILKDDVAKLGVIPKIGEAGELAPRLATARRALNKTMPGWERDIKNRRALYLDEADNVRLAKESLKGQADKRPYATQLREAVSNVRAAKLKDYRDAQEALANTPAVRAATADSVQATVAFAQGGRKVKWLNQYVLFLNAAMEGAKVPHRALQREPGRAGSALSGLMIGQAALTYYNTRFPEYFDIPLHERMGSIIIMLPRQNRKDALGNPVPARLNIVPRTREWAVFLAPVTHVMEKLFNEKPDSFNDVWRSFISEVVPQIFTGATPFSVTGQGAFPVAPPMPEVAEMFFEQATNYDLFRDKPIVPESLSMEEPAKQVFPWSSPLLTKLSGMTERGDEWPLISPIHLEHLFNTVFGAAGREVLTGLDYGYNELFREPEIEAIQKWAEEYRGLGDDPPPIKNEAELRAWVEQKGWSREAVAAAIAEEGFESARDYLAQAGNTALGLASALAERLGSSPVTERAILLKEIRAEINRQGGDGDKAAEEVVTEARRVDPGIPILAGLERRLLGPPYSQGEIRRQAEKEALEALPGIDREQTKRVSNVLREAAKNADEEQRRRDKEYGVYDEGEGIDIIDSLDPEDISKKMNWIRDRQEGTGLYPGIIAGMKIAFPGAAQVAEDPEDRNRWYEIQAENLERAGRPREKDQMLLAGYYAIYPTTEGLTQEEIDRGETNVALMFEQRDDYRNNLSDENRALLDRALAASRTVAEARYNEVVQEIKDTGFWDVTKNLAEDRGLTAEWRIYLWKQGRARQNYLGRNPLVAELLTDAEGERDRMRLASHNGKDYGNLENNLHSWGFYTQWIWEKMTVERMMRPRGKTWTPPRD